MSFRNIQPTNGKKKRTGHTVRVKRSYYTFSKYYPAGDTNRVYRKSISQEIRRKKKIRRIALISAGLLIFLVIAVIILL